MRTAAFLRSGEDTGSAFQHGFTLVEIIASFAILAVVATAVIVAVLGMAGVQQHNDQERTDNATVEEQIASGQEPAKSLEDLALPLGDYEIPITADTYGSDSGLYTVLNEGASPPPETVTLSGNVGAQESKMSYKVSQSGYYQLEVWGAAGLVSSDSQYSSGSTGGYAIGIVELTTSDTLYLNAGGKGIWQEPNGIPSGGANGGGSGEWPATAPGYEAWAGGGGGASDVRINSESLSARVIVAGGGGGGVEIEYNHKMHSGGYGGGSSGQSVTGFSAGSGGTQSAGGAPGSNDNASWEVSTGDFGQGGSCWAAEWPWHAGGGGGGGWYGGGAGMWEGGGGGSGWVYTAKAYSDWTGAEKSSWLLSSDYYLTDAKLVAGNANMPNPRNNDANMVGMRDAGYVRITWVGTSLE
jgi:prepilin-type N-terminal cleavage/methylation domain-containing protein